MTAVSVRRASRDDWSEVRRICCETGDGGRPVDSARRAFFGELWIGPYQHLLPDWTYVAETRGGLLGYLTGCPDTAGFERAKLVRSSLPLLAAIGLGRFAPNADTRRFVRRALGRERGPDRSFSAEVRAQLRRFFPAHLHVNLIEGSRGAGVGGMLADRFFQDLRGRQICGVHVFCGAKPVRFYERLGFREVARIRYGKSETEVWVLGRVLN